MYFQTLDKIIGHEEIRANLQRSLVHNRPAHAHLFFGPPGVGKATMAMAFIQALFCENRAHSVLSAGCGRCNPCQKVAQNNHSDLILVKVAEGKTAIGIDQIRNLAGFFSLTPMESSWKIALIDDASAMNEAAANALLKTLEEPPEQSLLFLISRQPGKLLPTIRSRCLKTRFSPLPMDVLQRILGTVTSWDNETIDSAVQIGGGNVGQMMAFNHGELPELRAQFLEKMSTLSSATLGQISALAEMWSQAEKFSLVVMFVRRWFQEKIHASVLWDTPPTTRETWYKTIDWCEQLFLQATKLNLNRRLVLEAVFIRLARIQGASC